MTPAGEILATEIRENGPIPFSRFMEVALYHPEHGYYRTRRRDPFGREGDFYTAAQLQPVFGRIVASHLRALGARSVVDLGAGRGEMREVLQEFAYTSVDRGDRMPAHFQGVVFANELFDALPVDVRDDKGPVLVSMEDGRFVWRETHGVVVEEHVAMRPMLETIASAVADGWLLAIDYGFHEKERVRFPRGTLMSYRRHQALDDVLRDPGEQDITAHVPWDAFIAHAESTGWSVERRESLAQFCLRAGEADEFADALHAESEAESLNLKMQLKSLIFGMGETFQVFLLRRVHK